MDAHPVTNTVNLQHQSRLAPEENKFHKGNGSDQKHYWLTPPDLYAALDAEFRFDFDPCPFPLPDGFDGLTCEWGQSNYVNPPFGSIMHQGKKKGPTTWVRKAIEEHRKGKTVVLVYPIDKWVLMILREILGEHAEVRNLGDVRWLATEFVLFGRRGTLPAASRVGRNWFDWKRPYDERGKPKHSAKPAGFFAMVEAVSPGPYLELFAREKRLGWHSWGNEVNSDVQLVA